MQLVNRFAELWALRPQGRRLHATALALMLTGLALAGAVAPLDNGLRDARFKLLQRPASGSLVIVEIDAASLRALETWPLPRRHYATAIENLRQAGAAVVALDVDFSARSSDTDDRRLEAAIAQDPGSIILPAFLQQRRNDDTRLRETTPDDRIVGDAVIANVNLFPEPDGRIRRGLYAVQSADGERLSLAAALAGVGWGRPFDIDFGIEPGAIPRLSLIDVVSGEFDPELVRDRRVLIGATALELGDELAVPVHGILSGVVVHALSYESMLQQRAIARTPVWLGLLAAFGLLAARLRRRRPPLGPRCFRASIVVLTTALAGPLLIQAVAPLSLELSIVIFAEIAFVLYLLLTEMRRRAEALIEQREAMLRQQALHDPETDLPNHRALCADIARLFNGHETVVVAVVGLDRLTSIRGAIGHNATNRMIVDIAQRLSAASGGQAARLESSLIAVARPAIDEHDALLRWCETLRCALGDTASIAEGSTVDIELKLGFACGGSEIRPSALVSNACAALSWARRHETDVTEFQPLHAEDPARRLSMMSDLMNAMTNGELSLVYQPKQSLKTGQIVGAEALLRWTHPKWGAVSPDVFVSAAEETGHIRRLTQWVMHSVVRDAETLAKTDAPLSLSFNLSAGLLGADEVIDEILSMAKRSPLQLVAEITETKSISDMAHAVRSLSRLRDAGIHISIDDYGVGLSSLSYLRLIEANELKLDKSFVASLMSNNRDRILIKSTIDLAHELGMKIAAEGVETEHVREMLTVMGCDVIQGYVFAKPMSLADITTMLAAPNDAERARTTG